MMESGEDISGPSG